MVISKQCVLNAIYIVTMKSS